MPTRRAAPRPAGRRRRNPPWLLVPFAAALLAVFIAGCGGGNPVSETWSVMGTFATCTVPAKEADALHARTDVVSTTFSNLNRRLTIFSPDSELSRLNRAAGSEPVELSADTMEVLRHALRYAELSRGCFEPTVGPLLSLWGFHGGQVPDAPHSPATVAETLAKVGYRHVRLGPGATAYLEKAGLQLDLGGIAKGYAVDVAYDRLVGKGVDNAMVNLGGNIRCRGLARRGTPWRVGVRDPFDRETIVGVLRLTDGLAVATSGNYERFVTIAGERYAHILDPRTGYPVKGMAGVTVVAGSALEADAMSTSLFVLGMEEGLQVLGELESCEALFVPDEQPLSIYITPGFGRYFTPLRPYAGAVKELPLRRR